MENLIYINSSIISAIFCKTSIAPFERLKILKQSQMQYNIKTYDKSIFDSLSYIYKNEGLRGLYKGNLINIMRVLPTYAIKFPLNDVGKKILLKKNNKSVLSFNEKLQAGLFTGLTQIIITYPINFIRTRISLDNKMISNNNNLIKYTNYVFKNEGIRSFYKGFTPSLLSYPIYVGLQMSLFSELYENNFNMFLSGSLAGLLAQTITYPGDTITPTDI